MSRLDLLSTPVLCLLLACGASVGCRSADASAWNLREVHDGVGGFDRRAAPMGHWEFNLRSAFDALGGDWVERNLGLEGKPERIVERPAELARRELLRLATREGSGQRLEGLQVEFATWLVVDTPDVVVRERAALMLQDAGRRLGQVQVQQGAGDDALDAEGVGALSSAVFEACEAGSAAELERVLDEVEAARLDREGAFRLLRALNVQLRQASRIGAARERFLAAHEQLQRVCCGLGLGAALRDVDDTVQAPAARFVWESEPEQGLELYIQGLERGLPRVLEALAWGVVRDGLPPEQATGQALAVWFEALMRAVDVPDGPAAVAAAEALQRLAPEVDAYLRYEDWVRWWGLEGRGQVLGAALEQTTP